MKGKNNTFVFDVVFLVCVVAFLMFIRLEAESNLSKIKSFVPEMGELQNELSDSNLQNYDSEKVDGFVSEVKNVVNYTLILYLILLPIGLIIIWIFTQGFIFKKLANVSLLRFSLYTLPFLISVFIFTIFSFEVLSSYLTLGIVNSLGWLFLSLLLVVVLGYFGFVGCASVDKKFSDVVSFGVKRFVKLWWRFLLLLFNAFSIYLLIGLGYVFLVIEYNLVYLVIPALALLGLLNWQRGILIRKFFN